MDRTTRGLSNDQDAALVAAALDGGNDALAAIYDRYADRVHTMCVHMLNDRDEAADVCGEVFLVAFTRLGQLRDPQRLRPWLFAIARHEVYRRTKRRGRVDLIEDVDEMDRIATVGRDEHMVEDDLDAIELARVVHDAAKGLDDRDRMVMELQLQGFDGDDLATALGTSTSTAYQHVHRMKERLERSVGAVLVARQGREECEQLDDLLRTWNGTFSVLWRKRVARHVDTCEVCERRRMAVPALLLGGGATALPMLGASAVSAAPASVRDRVLAEATVGSGGRGWRRDGFPPADGRGARIGVAAALVVVVLVLIGLLVATVAGGDNSDELVVDGDLAPTSTTTDAPVAGTSSSTTVPGSSVAPDPSMTTVVPEGPVESPGSPPVATGELLPPPPPPPPPAPSPPSPVALAVAWAGPLPATVFHPTPSFPTCGASETFVVDAPTSDVVQLRWSGSGADGLVEMLAVGGRWQAVLEVPPGVVGPLTVLAVGIAPGADGSSSPVTVDVASCIVPG